MTPSIATLLARGALAALLLGGGAGLARAQGEVPATQGLNGAAPADAGEMDEGIGSDGEESTAEPSVLPDGSTVTGTIAGYECGDNCYLTIRTDGGQDVVGLCAAEACTPWNENAEMPGDLVGRRVEAVTGTGTQTDASGNVMGEMTAFATLTVGE